MKKLGFIIRRNRKNKTYEMITATKEERIDKHTMLLNRKRFCVNKKSKFLSQIYWLRKVHKNPTKSRFIIAAPNCSLHPLSKYITAVFEILFCQIESYNNR